MLLVANGWLTHRGGDAWLTVHMWNGITVLVLVVFRVLWGLFGSSTARFARWVPSPAGTLRYARALWAGRRRLYLGHNPLGAWMILALLVAAGSQAFSGLFMVDSNGVVGGPFANTDPGEDPTRLQSLMTSTHVRVILIIAALALVHAVTNLLYQFAKGEPLVTAMVTGTKPVEDYVDEPAMRPARYLAIRAVLCLAAAVAIVLGGIKLAGGKLPG